MSWLNRAPRALLSLAVCFAALGGVAIGSDAMGAADAAAAAVADSIIEIRTEGASLTFTPDRISIKNGTRITIRYTNAGALPHNFVLLKNEDDLDTVGMAAFDAADTGYVPLQHKDRFIAYSELAKPGDTVEVTFVVPEPGEYTFVCLYPGHYNMMLGTLRSLK